MYASPVGAARAAAVNSSCSTTQAAPVTIETAIALVATWTDLTPTRRRDLSSALSTLAKMTGQPASAVTLTPVALRRDLPNRSAMTFGMTVGTMRNIMSAVRAVMRRLEVMDGDVTISSSWSELLAGLDPRQRAGLTAFARFCSNRQIGPGQADATALSAFEVYLTDRTLEQTPHRFIGKLRSAWNRFCKTIAGWPGQPIVKPSDPNQYVLPLAAFPLSFQEDVAAFGMRMTASPFEQARQARQAAATTPSGLLRKKGHKPVRAITRENREAHCRWAASAVVAAGVPIAEITSLAALVIPVERATAGLEYLYVRAGEAASSAGHHVADILRIIARHHVGLPDADLAELRDVSKGVTLKYTGMTEKNERAMRAMLTPACEGRFLALPEVLMKAARRLRDKALHTGGSLLEAARLALRATAIMFLTSIPLRVKNLCELRFEEHLHRDDPRSGLISYLSIQQDDTKTENTILVPVSTDVAAYIDEWTKLFRPAIAAPECRYLFPGHGVGDRPITRQGMASAIKTTMDQHVGVRLSPHPFRHLAAHMFLRAFPGHFGEVQRLLGHASIETTMRHYSGTTNEASMRRYDDVILSKRTNLKATHATLTATKTIKRRGGKG